MEDKRIKKSKRDLRMGLMELLKEKPFEKLTVAEICEQAMINKMTFYKHYQDKYALLDDCVQNIAIEIYTSCIGTQVHDVLRGDPVKNCVSLISGVLDECIRQKKIIFSLVESNNPLGTLIVKNSIEKLVETLVTAISSAHKLKYPPKAISAFLTGGFSNLILDQLHELNDATKSGFIADCTQLITDIMKNNIIFE